MGNKTSEIDDLLFSVRRSIRYHLRRCRFLDRCHQIFMTLTVIGGSGTLVTVLSEKRQGFIIWFAAVAALVSIIDLVFSPAQSARIYSDLSRRFINLEKSIVLAISEEKINDKITANFKAERLDIEADEPPAFKVLDSVCHNEMLRAMGYEKKEFLKIKCYERFFCNLFDIGEHKISKDRKPFKLFNRS